MRASCRGLLLLLLAAAPSPGGAQAPSPAPICSAAREGMVACFGEKLCECRYDPGGSMTVRPPGHRWDCGVLRPSCGIAYPADPAAPPIPLRDLPPILLNPAPGELPRYEGEPRLPR
jgi:hypothetical protein